MVYQPGAYPGFCGIKRLGVFLPPAGWDASPSQGYSQHKLASSHLYTWVERDKCCVPEHSTMSPARA